MWRLTKMTPRLFAVAVVGLMLVISSAPADAQSLNELRASGAIGEAFDGFARARGASMQGKVDDINAQRRAIYKQRATAQGVSASQVGRVYAQQIFNNSPAGTWFLGESGSWTRK
ncbi:MAG: YdbL family protein [Rhodospirillaceae bacterium]|jgi:uncharacterized protein|nr:YdbL family protein [Rhodospirillaceae bacterium]